jgi:hypothetical protein
MTLLMEEDDKARRNGWLKLAARNCIERLKK